MGEDVRVAQALFSLEAGCIARGGEVIAIEVAVGIHRTAVSVEFVRQGSLIPLRPARSAGRAATLHGVIAITRSVGQRLDATGDDRVGRRRGLVAEGAGRLSGFLDLALVHAVEVAVEIPSRTAHDAADQVLGVSVGQFGPRADIDAGREAIAEAVDCPDVRGGVGALLRVDEEARHGVATRTVVGFKEGRAERCFVDEAKALRRLTPIAGDERGVRVAKQGLEVARRPFGGTGRGEEKLAL